MARCLPPAVPRCQALKISGDLPDAPRPASASPEQSAIQALSCQSLCRERFCLFSPTPSGNLTLNKQTDCFFVLKCQRIPPYPWGWSASGNPTKSWKTKFFFGFSIYLGQEPSSSTPCSYPLEIQADFTQRLSLFLSFEEKTKNFCRKGRESTPLSRKHATVRSPLD